MEQKLYIFIILIALIVIFVIGGIIYKATYLILESFAHFISIIEDNIDNDIKFKNNLLQVLGIYNDELNNSTSTIDSIDKSDDDKSDADDNK